MEEEGPAVDLQFSDTGNSTPLLIYATSFGNIVGWDLRQPFNQLKLKDNEKITPAFKLENDLRDGILTSMAIYPDQVRFISIMVLMVYETILSRTETNSLLFVPFLIDLDYNRNFIWCNKVLGYALSTSYSKMRPSK